MSTKFVMFTNVHLVICLVVLATMSKRLISCSSCKQEHPPRGGIFCVYTREAKALCRTLGVGEEEFLLHIDIEKICVDS